MTLQPTLQPALLLFYEPQGIGTIGLANHPISGRLYVVAYSTNSGIGRSLYSISLLDPTSVRFEVRLPCNAETLAFNASGEAFITDRVLSSGRVYKWDLGSSPQLWNTGAGAPATDALATDVVFNQPEGIAFDAAQNMLIAESRSAAVTGRVWMVEAQTKKLRLVVDGLTLPKGVAFGPGGRSAYIADIGAHSILKVMLACVGA
jgi:sugar lactone lactonase YvrE